MGSAHGSICGKIPNGYEIYPVKWEKGYLKVKMAELNSIPGEHLLNICNLKTHYFIPEGVVKAVDDISLHIDLGETLGLVGESGCGKSVTALSILGLIPPPGRIVAGEIRFNDRDLTSISPSELRKIRGNRVSMVFQEPMTSLNPVYTIGNQIAEVYIEHQELSRKAAWERAVDMIRKVQIPSPSRRAHEYPHQLSGGMRQRAMIAIALACDPNLILADEPTTALDVTIQAQILDLMLELQESMGTSILMITHDLGVIAEISERVAVMYAGKIVEKSGTKEIFADPLHPYTKGLLNSVPILGQKAIVGKKRLSEIHGIVPSLYSLPEGCAFNPRCPLKKDICIREKPILKEVRSGRWVACWDVAEKHT